MFCWSQEPIFIQIYSVRTGIFHFFHFWWDGPQKLSKHINDLKWHWRYKQDWSRKGLTLKVVGPVIAEILLPKSLCGGGWWGWVCKPILVFSLSLSQAEQKFKWYFTSLKAIFICIRTQDLYILPLDPPTHNHISNISISGHPPQTYLLPRHSLRLSASYHILF